MSRSLGRFCLQIAGFVWALPWTLFGLSIGLVGLLSGGAGRCRWPTLEFHSGGVRWFLEHFPAEPMAMTLGHVILGRTEAALDISREHELVHVRQFERWGPLMIPAYLGCSLVLRIAGKDPYRDNPFEREAYGN